MALTTARQAEKAYKKLKGLSTTGVGREPFNEPLIGRLSIYDEQLWSDSNLIPTTAPTLSDNQILGVVKKRIDLPLLPVLGTANSFYHQELKDAIPSEFGDGSYVITIKDTLSNIISLGTGDWEIDTEAGVLTFFGSSTPSNLPPSATFYKYVGSKGQRIYDLGLLTGITSTYNINTPSVNSYNRASLYLFSLQYPNTGPVSFQFNNLSPVPIYKNTLTGITTLELGDLPSNTIIQLFYNGNQFQYNPPTAGSSSIGYVPENVAQKVTGITTSTSNHINYPSVLAVKNYVDSTTLQSVTFTQDIPVALSGGKSFGKYLNGQTVPAIGKTIQQVIFDIAQELILPTYTPPTIVMSQTATVLGEVGETVFNQLTATFNQNDAGTLTLIRIQQNGSDLTPNGVSSPFVKSSVAMTRILGSITLQALVNYTQGVIKYDNQNNLDTRTPAIRTINAPQAAENNFASAIINLTGVYKIFYGTSSSVPVNSNDIRTLSNSRFTNAGNNFILNTGTTNKIFIVAMPNTNSLVSVLDLTASNVDITTQYILNTFNVDDAGGNPTGYKIYVMQQAIPYAVNHQHSITIS